jgi:hypothetical protein
MKGREGEPSELASPPAHDVEWCVRTFGGDTLFVRARTAFAAVRSLGLAFSEARWVKPLPEDI